MVCGNEQNGRRYRMKGAERDQLWTERKLTAQQHRTHVRNGGCMQRERNHRIHCHTWLMFSSRNRAALRSAPGASEM